MDTLETYIKMCDCPEIQGQWKIEIGDDYWDDEEHQIVWYEGMESKEQIKGRIDVYKSDLQPKWIPRQDQIQVMMGFGKYPYVELQQFYKAMCGGKCSNPPSLKSFEQLWLAFYMKEKHKKSWNGKAWYK